MAIHSQWLRAHVVVIGDKLLHGEHRHEMSLHRAAAAALCPADLAVADFDPVMNVHGLGGEIDWEGGRRRKTWREEQGGPKRQHAMKWRKRRKGRSLEDDEKRRDVGPVGQ